MDKLADLLNMHLPIWDLTGRLMLALVCGAVIGWERERLGKPAGLRTHMLVALGCAVIMALAEEMGIQMARDHPNVNFDPGRVLQGVVTGIGFIGAGVIIHGQNGVRGLTTSAGIWVVGALGACCGAGFFGLALVTTILAFIVLFIFGKIEAKYGVTEEEKDARDPSSPNNQSTSAITQQANSPKTK